MSRPLDQLSNLPSDIVAQILARVPIRDAIRTSVLSRRWRHAWCSIPDLKFKDSCVNLPIESPSFTEEYVSFVYRVLLLHQGPVRKFKLSENSHTKFSDITQWVTFVSRNGVQELSLEFGYRATAPSSLFQCEKLTTLKLFYFRSLKLPVGFNGFMLLKKIVLTQVSISSSSLDKLISGCPLLESLGLYSSHSGVLKIHSPRLKYLIVSGNSKGFVFEKTPLLEGMSVTMSDDVAKHSYTLVQFIDRVPLLKKLVGLDYFARYCSVGTDSTTSGVTHNHLEFIKLSIDLERLSEVRLVIQLISSSPVLRELEIVGVIRGLSEEPSTSGCNFWSEAGDLGCELLQLKKVTMTASGSRDEIEFMKFVLLNSPVLETMTVNPSSKFEYRRLLSLLRCRRASTKAEIVFHEV